MKISAIGNLRQSFCMVRAIVGTLVDVGRKVITPEQFTTIISIRDRTRASQSAPARGLCLERVEYPVTIQSTGDEI